MILRPDEWETSEEYLFTHDNVLHKVNPMLGKIEQHDFYEKAIADSRIDPQKKQETITKLFNLYATDKMASWITADEVRKLQLPDRIDQIDAKDGWLIFTGIDVALSNDLFAVSYLCVNPNVRGESGEPYFFADMDAYTCSDGLKDSPNRQLFEMFAEKGDLHIIPGNVIPPSVPINRIAQLAGFTPDESGEKRARGNFITFMYDPYSSKIPINDLSAWVASIGIDPKQICLPCRQNFATFNGPVGELEFMIRTNPAWIHFSANSMWPWEAQNMYLAESNDGMSNRKPVKKLEHAKIDNWIALIMALIGYDIADGKMNT